MTTINGATKAKIIDGKMVWEFSVMEQDFRGTPAVLTLDPKGYMVTMGDYMTPMLTAIGYSPTGVFLAVK